MACVFIRLGYRSSINTTTVYHSNCCMPAYKCSANATRSLCYAAGAHCEDMSNLAGSHFSPPPPSPPTSHPLSSVYQLYLLCDQYEHNMLTGNIGATCNSTHTQNHTHRCGQKRARCSTPATSPPSTCLCWSLNTVSVNNNININNKRCQYIAIHSGGIIGDWAPGY